MYFAYQPILNRRQEVVAYELLFRDSAAACARVTDDVSASASVITSAFSHFGFTEPGERHQWFINVNDEMLLSQMIEALPGPHIVLEILETTRPTPALIERCRDLKKLGFTLALDDVVNLAGFEPMLDVVDIIKVDLIALSTEALPGLVKRLRHWPHLRLLAEKVETEALFQTCHAQGFELFQGYYFAHPALVTGKRLDAARSALLHLLNQINTEADATEIEDTFKKHPGLGLNLLKLVNTVSTGGMRRIDSLQHAIAWMGMRQMESWIQLLLYSGASGEKNRPLMTLAARRGKLMELLARTLATGESRSAMAYTVGMLSLVDALFKLPLAKVLAQIHLHDEIRAALLEHAGPLGRLLTLVEAMDAADFETVSRMAEDLGVDEALLADAQAQAMKWVGQLESIA